MSSKNALMRFGCAVVHNVSRSDVLQLARDYLDGSRSRRAVIAAINAQFVYLANHSSRFAGTLKRADLSVADEMSLVIGSRLLGDPLPERIAGVDLAVDLCRLASELGRSVYFLGGTQGAAEGTASLLRMRYRNLRIAGIDCPPLGFDADPAAVSGVVSRIQAAKPDVLLACFGAPKQEYWIEDNLAALPCKLVVGLGCTFDVLSGKVLRAPQWMQRSGLEWLYRLCSDPARLWERYLIGNSYFIWLVLSQVFARIFYVNREGVAAKAPIRPTGNPEAQMKV